MRRRKTESTNKRPETVHQCTCSGRPHCPHCGESLVIRRGPRINGRGFRVGKIASMYRRNRQVPMLRLSGRWLARAGFEIGQPIEIDVQRGKLTIMSTTDPAETAKPVAA